MLPLEGRPPCSQHQRSSIPLCIPPCQHPRSGASRPAARAQQALRPSVERRQQQSLRCSSLQTRVQAAAPAAAEAQPDTDKNVFEAEALLFDCDGVIVLSEEVHRLAYNATWEHFVVKCREGGPVAEWSVEFYDRLQNSVGGGKEKMRWFFNKEGWPQNTILPGPPQSDDDKTKLVDTLQDWKSLKYQDLVASGNFPAREGVLELFDQARDAGLKVGVCSASTKSSVIAVLKALLGPERFESLDVFLAGDDIPKKKPDPTVYLKAADALGVDPKQCLVIEDSAIGLQAAKAAGMRCVVTYTESTQDQPFEGAALVLDGLQHASPPVRMRLHRPE